MLGRGLESLIPPQGRRAASGENPVGEPVVVKKEESITYQKTQGGENVSYNISKKTEQSVLSVETALVHPNPHQPRTHFDETAMQELASSVREFGILQPLVVTKKSDGTYELIAGERRLRAAKLAGLEKIPVLVHEEIGEQKKLELAIIENIQREDLNPIEMARSFARLQDEFNFTQREIAQRLGKSREVVANAVRLLQLPSDIQDAVIKGLLSEGQARMLLSVESIIEQTKLFNEILKEHLTVKSITDRVKALKNASQSGGKDGNGRERVNPEFLAVKERLEGVLGTKVNVEVSPKGGKIVIEFYSPEELAAVLDKMGIRQTDN